MSRAKRQRKQRAAKRLEHQDQQRRKHFQQLLEDAERVDRAMKKVPAIKQVLREGPPILPQPMMLILMGAVLRSLEDVEIKALGDVLAVEGFTDMVQEHVDKVEGLKPQELRRDALPDGGFWNGDDDD